jgi:hypothetical protein
MLIIFIFLLLILEIYALRKIATLPFDFAKLTVAFKLKR